MWHVRWGLVAWLGEGYHVCCTSLTRPGQLTASRQAGDRHGRGASSVRQSEGPKGIPPSASRFSLFASIIRRIDKVYGIIMAIDKWESWRGPRLSGCMSRKTYRFVRDTHSSTALGASVRPPLPAGRWFDRACRALSNHLSATSDRHRAEPEGGLQCSSRRRRRSADEELQ
jgi:hypothetical protein